MADVKLVVSENGGRARVAGGGSLQGELQMPGDKSVSHRAVMFAALAEGESRLTGLSNGEDVAHTMGVVKAMGAKVRPGALAGEFFVEGRAGKLAEPFGVADVGNAGTGLRLFCGLWAGQDGLAVFVGDHSLGRRPIDRVAEPLRQMGAYIDGRGGRYTPVVVRGGKLRGIEYTLPVASAQTKSAVLLAGLGADGATTVHEPVLCRQHTEELLRVFGANITMGDGKVTVERSSLRATDVHVPGDPSQAAFWICAAAGLPGAQIRIPNLYLGPARDGFLEILGRMDADIVRGKDSVEVRGRRLNGAEILPQDIPGLVDELPALAIAAILAKGKTTVRGAEELRIKESDRIATILAMAKAFGASTTEYQDGMDIEGVSSLTGGGTVDADGDHRIAMAAALLGSLAPGETVVTGWESVATSYPDFAAHLEMVA